MRRMKSILAGIMVLLCFVGGVFPMTAFAAAGLSLSVVEERTPEVVSGEAIQIGLKVKNETENIVENIEVHPDLGMDGSQWPFATEFQEYKEVIKSLNPGEEAVVSFNLTGKNNIENKRYNVVFVAEAKDMEVSQRLIYVNGKVPEPIEEPQPQEEPEGESEGEPEEGMGEMPMVSNGEPVYSGSGSTGNKAVPRVIVTGFRTEPAEVRAGANFTLFVQLKNTSKTTTVSNMLFDFNASSEGKEENVAPAFLPTSGSSSVYIDSIGAGGAGEVSINLNAKADLVNKPYGLGLKMVYEDGSGNQIEGNSELALSVRQSPRFELSDFDIAPDEITVGEESNVMCNLYNLGRIKLYNVKASFTGAAIEKEEIFLGHVESGATASIDVMLKGTKAAPKGDAITMTVSYEDEAGNQQTMTKEMTIKIEKGEDTTVSEMDVPQKEKSGIPIVPIVAGIVILGVFVTIILKVKKKKGNGKDQIEEELLDALEGYSED